MSVSETFEKYFEFTIYDLSMGDLAISDLAIGDLAIGCLGVRAIESLDVRVRVATNFVEVMKRKKIATSKFSNLDSSILNSARNYSSNGLCLILSFFGIEEFCRPCSCRRLVRIFVVGSKSLLALIGPA